MSRDQIIKIAMVVCVAVLLCAVIVTSTGVVNFNGIGGYNNAEMYTAGDTEITGEIRNIDINWTSGKVTVAIHTDETVMLRESAKRSLSEDEKLQWWLDGDTLRVQFAKPGIRWNMPEKMLTLTLPQGAELKNAAIHTTSGDIEIPEMKAGELLVLDTTSGDIRANAEAKNAEINTTSGDQQLKITGKSDILRINSTSGNIGIEAEGAETLEAASTSGGISSTADDGGAVKANSTSGNIYVMLGKMNSLDIDATSGNVTAALPAEPGFTAHVGTTSGAFNSDIALTRNGDDYVCGNGSVKVSIDTTSGNIRMEEMRK